MDAVAADALDREVLDRPQQLGLRRQRQVGHFVEKQRAAVGVLELAAAAAHAGGRALLDAEELRFEQRLDQRRAVDRRRTGPRGARLSSWIWRATSSLPVPDSPSISTVKSVDATRSIVSRSACIAGVDPMSGAAPSSAAGGRTVLSAPPARWDSISRTSAPIWLDNASVCRSQSSS